MLNRRTLSNTLAGMALLAFGTQALPVVGTSSGTFTNPVGPSTMVTTGVGTDHFTWGTGVSGSPSSSLDFNGAGFAVETGDVFAFGNLSYYNGTIAGNSGAEAIDFNVLLSLTTPVSSEAYSFNFQLINTVNNSDPNASADIVQLGGAFSSSAFNYAGVDYTLEFIGFGTISGSGFTTVNQFHVLENRSANAQLLGRITAAPAAVPEPGTIALFGLGLVGLGFSVRARRRA